MLKDKFKCPVYSLLLLLRPQANASSITGELTWRDDNKDIYLLFKYKFIKAWELPGLELLHGNLGTVPLAFLTDDGEGHIEEWVQVFNERADQESIAEQTRQRVLILSSLLAGLRYNEEVILKAFHGVNIMKESSTYQYFFREAREEGRLEGKLEGELNGIRKGKSETLISILRSRFGEVPPQLQARYQAVTDLATLDAAILKAITIQNLDEFA